MLRILSPLILVLLLIVSQAQEQPRNRQAEKPRVVSSFTAEPGSSYPFRQNMYRALLLPDGRLIALSIARENRQQTMQSRYSTNNGQSWSSPEDLFRLPKEAGGFGLFEALVDQQGEIHIFFLCDANTGIMFAKEEVSGLPKYDVMEIWHVRSKDKVKGWETLKRIRKGKNGDLLSVTQLRNGRIVLPINFDVGRSWDKRGEGFLQYTFVGPWTCSAMYSDDNGKSWHESPDILDAEVPDLSTYGSSEPVVIQLKDGRVWMLLRTQLGRFYESFSKDGHRWSRPKPTNLISSDSPAALIRLKDGSLMLFTNACLRYPYAYGARPVLHGAISRDEGRTWQGFREIAHDPHRDQPPPAIGDYGVSYSFPTLTADGHVLFSMWVEQGNIRRFRLVDPAWLLETRAESNFSDDLELWSTFGSKGVAIESDNEKQGAKLLSLKKAEAGWPAGAVWNFPIGLQGKLRLQLKLGSGFGGAVLGLTDHFSPPWDEQDTFFNLFNLPIDPSGNLITHKTMGGPTGGRSLAQGKLIAERWYQLELAWDVSRAQCGVLLDGQHIGVIPINRNSGTLGINYLRLRSTAGMPDSGLQIRSLNADVSPQSARFKVSGRPSYEQLDNWSKLAP